MKWMPDLMVFGSVRCWDDGFPLVVLGVMFYDIIISMNIITDLEFFFFLKDFD